jgi:DNA polymerase-1
MNKLLLVDGHNLLFKAFYGVPERLLPDGKPIQGLIGFIGMLRKMLRQVEPTHVLIVFDPEGKHSRKQFYTQYKANRHDFGGLPDRENPFSQLNWIKNALDNLGIKWVEEAGCEADDVIASYAVKSACQIVISSSDTDLFQLISHKISVFRYHGEKSILFDEDQIVNKYGVHPTKFLEYKALTGDKTDNVAGLKGVGPKTAAKVLRGERTLSPEELKTFEVNMNVLRLNTDIQLPYEMEQLLLDESIHRIKIGSFVPRSSFRIS